MANEDNQRNDLLLFLELFKELDDFARAFGDKPDLVITRAANRLGVEHTRLYIEDPELKSGQQLRPQERLHFQITQRAFELFRSGFSIPLYLTVEFEEPYNYRARDVTEVATALSNAVQQALSLNPQSLTQGLDVRVYAWQFQRFRLPFPRGVKSFHYMLVEPNRGFELWAPILGYCVPHLSATTIESVIEKKEKLLETYLTSCEHCWLLIATDAGWRSSHFVVPPDVIDHLYVTEFEKVFLMTITHRTLTELTTQAPAK